MDARNFFSEDGRTAMGYFNDEATIHTHQVIADMRAAGSAINASDATMMEGIDLLPTGQLATSIIDNVVALRLLEASGIRWGAAVVPVEKEGDLPFVPVWSDGLGVFSASDHPEEAKLFATFLGTEGSRLRMETTGDLPLNMRLAEELNWAGDSEGRQEILAAVQMARPAIFIPDYWGVIDPMVLAFDSLMIEDGLTAQEAFDEVAPLVQENLDESWATWDQIQPAQ
jgi:ABC-type glycerol-3-phosphate transport system substrate-binding protein